MGVGSSWRYEGRIGCKTVGFLAVCLLLALQAGVGFYFIRFSPTHRIVSPTGGQSPQQTNDKRAGLLWVGGIISDGQSRPEQSNANYTLQRSSNASEEDSYEQAKSASAAVSHSTADPSANDSRSLTTQLQSTAAVHLVPAPYFNSYGPTWKKGSFCDKYVEKEFEVPVAVCGVKVLQEHNIKCLRNEKSTHTVYCTVENVAVFGPRGIGKPLSISLLTGEKSCPSPSMSGVQKTTEKGDQTRGLLDKIVANKPESGSVCHKWINKTAFLYSGDQSIHVYFRMNAYFNLHKAIAREGVHPGEFVIIRLPYRGPQTYLFPEWERKLFPEMLHIDELPNATLCFRKLVLVPGAFSCILFRCKMGSNVRSSCFNCKGRGLYGSSLYAFRHRVLSSCGLQDEEHHIGNRITIVSRTPYKRWSKDTAQNFQRVLGNEKELVTALEKNFPHTNVTVAHMEAIDICTQIRLAHDADVVMGVHGAGLVHIWWLQEDALAFELNPTFELSNPTFKMLSTLTGRNYRSINVSGSKHLVTVKIDNVIKELKSHTHLF